MSSHNEFMNLALEEAEKSRAEGNIAVGSVIAYGEKLVARGRNLVNSTFDPTAHAETVALREAGSALRRVEFSDHTLYTTFEPCPMCCGAILTSGISTLVVGARYDPVRTRWADYTIESLIELAGRTRAIDVVTGVLAQPCFDIWLASTTER